MGTALFVLAVVLSALGAGMFWVIAWLRKSSKRYRFFELFVCLFLLAIGCFVLWRLPADPNVVLRSFGFAVVVASLVNLPLALQPFRKQRELRCSFCGKGQRSVEKLIAGPAVNICNECVKICSETLLEK